LRFFEVKIHKIRTYPSCDEYTHHTIYTQYKRDQQRKGT